jgi:hypothetical protein
MERKHRDLIGQWAQKPFVTSLRLFTVSTSNQALALTPKPR